MNRVPCGSCDFGVGAILTTYTTINMPVTVVATPHPAVLAQWLVCAAFLTVGVINATGGPTFKRMTAAGYPAWFPQALSVAQLAVGFFVLVQPTIYVYMAAVAMCAMASNYMFVVERNPGYAILPLVSRREPEA
jgi:hypothetical protein